MADNKTEELVEPSSLRELEDMIGAELQKARLWLRTSLMISIVLVVFVLAYVMWVSTSLRKGLDEVFLADMIATHVEEDVLPEARPRLDNAVLSVVPKAFDRLIKSGVDYLPTLRRTAEKEVLRSFEQPLDQLQGDLDKDFERLLIESESDIRAAMHGLSDEDKEKALTKVFSDTITKQYEENSRQYIRSFRDQVNSLETYITTLLMTPEEDLSLAQRDERRLLLLALANIESLAERTGVSKD